MKKLQVLVIDDEQIVLDSIKKILAEENFEVDVTLNAGGGIYSAISKHYDIVLTDIRMPDIGGMHVLRDIKRAKPSLPVLMITGYASVQSAVQAMKLGAADYLEKPFTPEELVETVNSVLAAVAEQEIEEQGLIHKEEVLRILDRTATDDVFVRHLLTNGAVALEEYDLTTNERLALVTGDIKWIEEQIGPLTAAQKQWFEQRLSAEIW